MTVVASPSAARAPSPGRRPLAVEEVLAEQQTLAPDLASNARTPPVAHDDETAVDIFARHHDSLDPAEPLQARHYSALLPASPPKAGEQYAFEVDLDACSGCKACVAACHSLNGLADDEAWRDVGLLISPPDGPSTTNGATLPVLQHVTTACHHCLDPGCLRGCPVNAYEKDPATGIVRHLDDQCFGCQYCTLMCPYEVPKYHAGHGIVRKCDMCSGRLAAGEAPACVQACPHEAIRIRTVSVDGVRVAAARAAVCKDDPGVTPTFAIPHAPPVQQTVPTTIYRSERVDVRPLEPVDLRTPQPAHAHGPLTVMLALSQLGVGAMVAAAVLSLLSAEAGVVGGTLLAGFLVLNAGLAAATLHLGRPHLAFRAVLGWRHSWLSREAIAFGGLMPLAGLSLLACFGPQLGEWLPAAAELIEPFGRWQTPLLAATAIVGLAAVMTSVMIYVAARKPLWSLPTTTARFLLTTALGGAATTLAVAALVGGPLAGPLVAVLIATAGKLLLDAAAVVGVGRDTSDPRVRSARLIGGPLRPFLLGRLALAGAGVFAAIASLAVPLLAIPAAIALAGGEIVERWLFFTAVTGPRMPGGLPA